MNVPKNLYQIFLYVGSYEEERPLWDTLRLCVINLT